MVRVIAVLLALACLSSGCAAWQRAGGPAAIECAGDKLATRVVLVVPLVLAVLSEGKPGDLTDEQKDKLKQIGMAAGFDVLGCAIKHIDLSAPPVKATTSKLLGAAR